MDDVHPLGEQVLDGQASVTAEKEGDEQLRRQVLVDSLLPAVAYPRCSCIPSCRRAARRSADYLSFEFDDFFSWNFDFEGMDELCHGSELEDGRHRVRKLPPRFDFFSKHPSQFK